MEVEVSLVVFLCNCRREGSDGRTEASHFWTQTKQRTETIFSGTLVLIVHLPDDTYTRATLILDPHVQHQEDPALAIYFANIVYFVLIPDRKFYLHITVVNCTNSIDYKKQVIFS